MSGSPSPGTGGTNESHWVLSYSHLGWRSPNTLREGSWRFPAGGGAELPCGNCADPLPGPRPPRPPPARMHGQWPRKTWKSCPVSVPHSSWNRKLYAGEGQGTVSGLDSESPGEVCPAGSGEDTGGIGSPQSWPLGLPRERSRGALSTVPQVPAAGTAGRGFLRTGFEEEDSAGTVDARPLLPPALRLFPGLLRLTDGAAVPFLRVCRDDKALETRESARSRHLWAHSLGAAIPVSTGTCGGEGPKPLAFTSLSPLDWSPSLPGCPQTWTTLNHSPVL